MTSNNASFVEADRTVRAVLEEACAAWAANAVLPGIYLPDRQAIRSTMATLFAGERHGSKGVHQVQSIRFVGADVAVVIGRRAMLLAGQIEPDAANRALETWVLSSQDGPGASKPSTTARSTPPKEGRRHGDAEQAVRSGHAALDGGPPGDGAAGR